MRNPSMFLLLLSLSAALAFGVTACGDDEKGTPSDASDVSDATDTNVPPDTNVQPDTNVPPDTNVQPDTNVTPDGDDTTDVVAACTVEGFSATVSSGETDNTSYVVLNEFSSETSPFDWLAIELWAGYGNDPAIDGPGTYQLGSGDELSYDTCGTCVMISGGCDDTGACTKDYWATAGTLTITQLDGANGALVGTLTDVVFTEASIDWSTGATTIGGTDTWCVDSYAISADLYWPSCAEAADCDGSPDGPICDTTNEWCVECLATSDCNTTAGETCNTEFGICEAPFACTAAADCATDPNGNLACDVASGACVECIDATTCDATASEACDATTFTCYVPCTLPADCATDPAGPVCDTGSGYCVECLISTDCDTTAGETCVDMACVPAPADLVINEFGVYPAANEAIELYNNGATDVLLDGYTIVHTNAAGTATTLYLPAGITITAGGFTTLTNSELVDSTGAAIADNWLANTGAEIALVDAIDRTLDTVAWGTVGDAPAPLYAGSTSRVTDGADTDSDAMDFNVSNAATLGAANDVDVVNLGGTLVINEFLVDTTAGATGYVELFNADSTDAVLDGWVLFISSADGSDFYTFGATDTVTAGGFLVLDEANYAQFSDPQTDGWMHLFNAAGERVQSVRWTAITVDGTASYALATDGTPSAYYGDLTATGFASATPSKGAAN